MAIQRQKLIELACDGPCKKPVTTVPAVPSEWVYIKITRVSFPNFVKPNITKPLALCPDCRKSVIKLLQSAGFKIEELKEGGL